MQRKRQRSHRQGTGDGTSVSLTPRVLTVFALAHWGTVVPVDFNSIFVDLCNTILQAVAVEECAVAWSGEVFGLVWSAGFVSDAAFLEPPECEEVVA